VTCHPPASIACLAQPRADLHRLLGPAEGLTYPQRGPTTLESFSAYFYGGGTVIVGLVSGTDETEEEGEIEAIPLEEVRAGRDWDRCLGGFFYVSPQSYRDHVS
jgi:hypothetical protein